jgi:hypothetical protein
MLFERSMSRKTPIGALPFPFGCCSTRATGRILSTADFWYALSPKLRGPPVIKNPPPKLLT